jgi:hypothetical protein
MQSGGGIEPVRVRVGTLASTLYNQDNQVKALTIPTIPMKSKELQSTFPGGKPASEHVPSPIPSGFPATPA